MVHKKMHRYFVSFSCFFFSASRELLSGGVRLSDVTEKLIRGSKKEEIPKPQAQFAGGLTDQLNRLRRRRYYKAD